MTKDKNSKLSLLTRVSTQVHMYVCTSAFAGDNGLSVSSANKSIPDQMSFGKADTSGKSGFNFNTKVHPYNSDI